MNYDGRVRELKADNVQHCNSHSPKDELFSRFVTLFIFSRFISNFIPCLTNLLGSYERYADPVLYVLLGIVCVPCLGYILRHCKLRVVIFGTLSMLVISINVLLFPSNITVFRSTIQSFVILCIPIVFFLNSIDNYEHLKNNLTKMARIIGWILAVAVLTSSLGYFDSKYHGEYFGVGYSCLLPGLILMEDAIENKNKVSWIMLFFTVVFLLMYGNRLPLLAIALFGFYVLLDWLYIKKRREELIFVFLSSILVILFLLLLGKSIMQWLYTFLLSMGIESRTLMLGVSGKTLLQDPRIPILRLAIGELISEPFVVRGINADMVNLGVYPHNLFIEIIYQFGGLFGGTICLILIYYIIRTLRLGVKTNYGKICVILMFASITQLMVSLSLWNSPYFWAWLVLIVQNKKLLKGEEDRNSSI